jgi:large subunit ribosomal protein L31
MSACAFALISPDAGWSGRLTDCSAGPLALYRAPILRGGSMKQGIHPDYHEITVVMTDGTTYQTRSTYGKAGDTLRLDIDSKSHPAWTGGQQRLIDTGGQLARFNKRFQGFGIKR